jgi:FlaA1/EpsC-like NDP-sugar epimerase
LIISLFQTILHCNTLFNNYILVWIEKKIVQQIADAALIVVSLVVAVILRGDDLSVLANPWTGTVVVSSIIVTLYCFNKYKLYKVVLRSISDSNLRSIIHGVLIGAGTMFWLSYFFSVHIPTGLILINAMIIFLSVSFARFWIRSLIRKASLTDLNRVVIYGAGHTGQQLAAALNFDLKYQPVAFVDDDVRLHGSTINGICVHSRKDLPIIIKRYNVRDILLAMPRLDRQSRKVIVASLESLGVKIKTISSIGDLITFKAPLVDLRNIVTEDLLGRDPVPPKPELISQNITGKVVMVTGAGGSIGAELCRIIVSQKPAALIMLDVSEYSLYAIVTELRDDGHSKSTHIFPVMGSVQNPSRMREILKHFRVQTVFHTAAYKHVLLVEENLIESIYNNIFGTKVVAEASVECGVENFTLISTDKTIRPKNVLGATKRIAELICQSLSQKQKTCTFSIVRFGNVLGSSGSVVKRFSGQIERGGPVTVTHPDVTRYFMTITEAAQLVIQAGSMARGGDVFVMDMGQPLKILDLAKSMIRQHGFVPYLVNGKSNVENNTGDIQIEITGLGHGEKLHEEMLIKSNSQVTNHPRIMLATDISMAPDVLEELLDELWASCKALDLHAVRQLLLRAPIEYKPDNNEIHDIMLQKLYF